MRWYEVDHPSTQADKRARLARLGVETPNIAFLAANLEHGGLAGALCDRGFDPDGSPLLVCEGVTVYLDTAVLPRLLGELRALATIGTRLAISLPAAASETAERRRGFAAVVAALGEPVKKRAR